MVKERRLKSANINFRDDMASLVEEELEGDFLVTIIRAEVSANLEFIRFFISVLPDKELKNVLEKLTKRAKNLAFLFAKKNALRKVPKIEFAVDSGGENFSKVEQILSDWHKENSA